MKKENIRCIPEPEAICFCSIEGVLGIISKKWGLQIISTIGNYERLRYGELEQKLGGISPKTLSDRLKELEGANLIKRETFSEIPPRVEYTLTNDGQELRNALIPLMNWAQYRDTGEIYQLH